MTSGLALRNQETIALSPQEVVVNATAQAKLLMSIVEQTGCFQLIAKKKYLQVEAWETIGAFNQTHAVTDSVTPIIIEGVITGYEANVKLWKGDMIVGGARMPCFFTETACKGKEGDAKHKAAMSAAQTFATSKAYRMNFSYVAILAGYEPTPAEEFTGEDTLGSVKPRTKQEHWCEEHETKFFKRGTMKSYGHLIVGTKEWCNEPAPKPTAETGTSPEPIQQATKSQTSEAKTEGDIIPSTDGLLEELYGNVMKAKKWNNTSGVRSFLVNVCHIEEHRIDDDPAGVWQEVKQII